jgi:predicted ester cyclase
MEHDIAELIDGIFREVIDGGDADRIDAYFTPDFVDHTPFGDAVGREAFVGFIDSFRAALPDFHHHVADVQSIGADRVVWRIRVTGTFTGTFMGVEGDGRPFDLYVANAARLRDGRVAEHWSLGPETVVELCAQLGVQPAVPA